MAIVGLDHLAQFLLDYDWAFAKLSEQTLASGFQTDSTSYDLDVHLIDEWVVLEIASLTDPLTEEQQLSISDLLLACNGEMIGSRFSLEPDGTVSLTLDLPRDDLTFDEFAEALDVLSEYAVTYSSSIRDAFRV